MEYKLYHGASSYLSLEAAHSYIEEIKEENPSTSINIVDGDSINSQDLIDLLASPTLFTSKRTLFIKRIYRNKDKKTVIENILEILEENKSEDLVVFWEDQKIRSNTKYYKFFKNNKAVEEISDLNKRTFFTWLRKELEKNDLKIDQSAIKELAERTNYDPERCKSQIEKFKLNNPDKIIEKEDIELFAADTLERQIWDLTDAINQQDKERSVAILEKLSSQSTDANYILAMLGRNLRLIYLTKHLVEKGYDYRKISSILKIPPFTAPALVKASSKYSDEKIKLLYSKLSNLDLQIKTGKIDPDLGLTLICPFL